MENKEDRISTVEYALALELIARKMERLESRDKNYLHNPRYKDLRRTQDSIYEKLRKRKNSEKGGGTNGSRAEDYEMGQER